MSSAGAASSAPPAGDNCCRRLPWMAVMRIVGACLGIVIMILGFVGIFTVSFSPRSFVDYCYQVLFGGLIVLAELRMEKWLKFFTFLNSYAGLGVFYIFVGGLALDGTWYQILIAVLLLSLGLIYFTIGCCYRQKMYEQQPAQQEAPAAQQMKPMQTASSAFTGVAVDNRGGAPYVAAHVQEQAFHDNTPESAWPEMEDK